MRAFSGAPSALAFAALLASAGAPAASAQGIPKDTSHIGYDDSLYSVDPPAVVPPGDAVIDSSGSEPSAVPADTAKVRAGRGSTGAARDSADDALELQEKSVQGRSTKVHREKEVSRIRLTRKDMQRVAAAQGDPLKVLSTLPGVTNQNDLSVRPFVRGGKAEETQILWDGVPLLQPYHFGTLYSIFNTESLESMTLYSGGFPVEAGNALSAALFMEARPAPLDSFKLFTDLSFLRGSAYAGVPLIKDKLAVSVSWQAFWYDWVVNRAYDFADLIQNDSAFSAQKQEFRRYLELPNFRDLQFGLNWRMNDKVNADYVGLISRDGFHARNAKTRYYRNGREVSDYWWQQYYDPDDKVNSWTQRRSLDTIANVSVDNQVHGLHFHWRPTENWEVEQGLAYQWQNWHVKFSDDETWHDSIAPDGSYAGYRTYGPSVRLLQLGKQAFDWNLNAKWQASSNHLAKLGLFQSTRVFDYDTRLERSIYEVIVNGSVDVTDGLGYLDPNGLTLRQGDYGVSDHVDYLSSLPNLIRFDFDGRQTGTFMGAYLSDDWSFDDSHRVMVGSRVEMDTWSGQAFMSPRVAYYQGLGRRDELTLASGVYSQSDFPFNQRDAQRNLRPEKAFHANAEWTHHFSKNYRMEFQVYQKNYYDLVVPVIRNTGRIDWHGPLTGDLDSAEFAKLSPAIQAVLIERLGEKDVGYRNGGVGKAAGGELSFFYDPKPFWSGWVSAEAGYSKRRDFPDQVSYDFRYSRPWAFNWVNYFHMPSNYELSLRGRYAAGLPYSEFRMPGFPGAEAGGDTVFYLSPRNAARYAPYSRWDIRLSKEFRAFGHPMQSYMEIWNTFNTPNFIMMDQKTRQWKFIDANYPIPILFMGLNFRW